ncbi:uncharacterized protein HD556DRAFT_1305755 [Suillus plorans]|uniref:Uncharacterized protein n=1 Tax=Suillus plorans TaxID=116603 RepID=A0A9P7J211_9AGAM|nr:uncharacterized protein HD556DRAFT_1305755 [Suillus plorans]KAG1798894.1 hypothetical protein HD556DRAFT_1305755 [Suillus plorans]
MTIVSDDPARWPFISFCHLLGYFAVASSTAVIYNWALTFGREFELILVRYIGIIYSVYVCRAIYMTLQCADKSSLATSAYILQSLPVSITDAEFSGTIVWYIGTWSPVIVNAMLGVIMVARINAMYQGSKNLFIFLVVMLLGSTITSGVMVVIANLGVSGQEAIFSGYHICWTEIDMYKQNLNFESMISTVVWEILALFLTVWIVIKHIRELRQSPTGSTIGDYFMVLAESHAFYFLAFATMACFTLGLLSPSITSNSWLMESPIFVGVWSIAQMLQMFVLGPRLILSIREYHAKLVARADEEIGMTLITFQAGGDALIDEDALTGGDV